MNTKTQSLWAIEDPARHSSPLPGDIACDVCVVGAGIAGLTTAYLLAREGRKVVVLDAKPEIASGESQFTSAHLAWYLDDTFSLLVSIRGEAVARTAAHSHKAAIDLIEDIVRTESIACDFIRVNGFLFPGKDGPDVLNKEEKTLLQLVLAHERSRLAFPSGKAVDCLKFPDHAQFHPLKYLSRLAAAIRNRGGVIHTRTVVEKVRGGGPCRVTTTHGHTVSAAYVVIATNNPFEAGTEMHNKVAAYLTYVFAAEVPKSSTEFGLYWDTEEPYHYVRRQSGDACDYIIVGGEDHK